MVSDALFSGGRQMPVCRRLSKEQRCDVMTKQRSRFHISCFANFLKAKLCRNVIVRLHGNSIFRNFNWGVPVCLIRKPGSYFSSAHYYFSHYDDEESFAGKDCIEGPSIIISRTRMTKFCKERLYWSEWLGSVTEHRSGGDKSSWTGKPEITMKKKRGKGDKAEVNGTRKRN